jgi:hypothetical protein
VWSVAGLLVLSLICSWLNLPRGTFVSMFHGDPAYESIAAQIQFNSLWLVSALINVLLFLDARREMAWSHRGVWKQRAVLITTFLIILGQIVTGERESFGLIVALVAIYLNEPYLGCRRDLRGANRVFWARFPRACATLVLIALVYLALGHVRMNAPPPTPAAAASSTAESLLDAGERIMKAEYMPWRGMWVNNTWTSVLLTNVGLARDALDPTKSLLLGKTYWDYVLSLPPGVLSRAIGYQRPIDTRAGPYAWYRHLSHGGMHPVCVPHRNFGAAGVLAIMCLFGIIIGWAELTGRSRSLGMLMCYGTVLTCSFVWFWYSEMGLIRGAIIGLTLVLGYRWVARPVPIRPGFEPSGVDPAGDASNALARRSVSH